MTTVYSVSNCQGPVLIIWEVEYPFVDITPRSYTYGSDISLSKLFVFDRTIYK